MPPRACPACATALAPWFVKEGLEYGRCPSCGGAFAAVPPGEPARYHDYLPALTTVLPGATRNRYAELLASFAPWRRTGRLLDVGCGGGFFVGEAAAAGWEAEGTEVSAAAVAFAKGRGLRVHHGVLSDGPFRPATFDVLALFEVLEHVPDPGALMAESAALLRPGGFLYATTPNMGSLTRRLLGADWSVISRDHVSLHTARTLRVNCARTGLEPLGVLSRNILPHEIGRAFRRRRADAPAPGPMERTVALQARIESNVALGAAKRAANLALRVTGLGDTLVLRARRR